LAQSAANVRQRRGKKRKEDGKRILGKMDDELDKH
jgi:hypothetical protein